MVKKYHEPRSGEWYLENFEILRAHIIAKYYVQVMLLFVYNRSREIFGNVQETFLFTVEKNKHRRLMKVIYKSRLLRSLKLWYNKVTLLNHRFLLLYHYYVEIVML